MKTTSLLAVLILLTTAGYTQKPDTVKISLGQSSRIIFTMENPEDLEILKHYNFQQMFMDMIRKLETRHNVQATHSDSVRITEEENGNDIEEEEPAYAEREDEQGDDWPRDTRDDRDDQADDDDDDREWYADRKWHRTRQSFNFDLGLNNYLEDGGFPTDGDQYAVRPWGSWYVGIASVQRSRVARNFFIEWGLGMSWYTFKFEDDNTIIIKGEEGLTFGADTRDVNFIKSKLSVSYVQASLIPVIDFNDRSSRNRFWESHKDSFRIGVGPYIGYRISSRTKLVYNDDGREKDKDRDNYYLNNFRYGVRLQVGYRSTDLFFNYDMNDLFSEGKGPGVNAISFGVIF